jgi:hypothetical protein
LKGAIDAGDRKMHVPNIENCPSKETNMNVEFEDDFICEELKDESGKVDSLTNQFSTIINDKKNDSKSNIGKIELSDDEYDEEEDQIEMNFPPIFKFFRELATKIDATGLNIFISECRDFLDDIEIAKEKSANQEDLEEEVKEPIKYLIEKVKHYEFDIQEDDDLLRSLLGQDVRNAYKRITGQSIIEQEMKEVSEVNNKERQIIKSENEKVEAIDVKQSVEISEMKIENLSKSKQFLITPTGEQKEMNEVDTSSEIIFEESVIDPNK